MGETARRRQGGPWHRRQPERTVLYEVIREHLSTFLDRAAGRGSGKGRGFCPSYTGRRIADTAAHLVDRVLPRAPVRRWVLSFPREVKWHLARDAALLSGAITVFMSEIFRYLLRPAFAQERLSRLPDGRVAYDLRRARWDGGTRLILEPLEFLSKLAALVPAPRSHLLRCHGRMRVIAFLTHRPTLRKILAATGLSSEVPARAPPRDPPQQEFVFDQ